MASSGELAGAASATPSSSSGAGAGILGTEERSRPTTGIARREGLRGLGEELIRLDVQYQSAKRVRNQYHRWWSNLFKDIVSVADSGLHDALHPYIDPLLLETHGEQLLSLVIRLASKQQWKRWLDTSMKVAVSTAAADVFSRLFAAHEDPVGNETLRPLLVVVRAGTNVEILSAIIAASAGRKEPSVSATDIARRGELRGLGGELVRLDMQHQSPRRISSYYEYRYPWSNLIADIAFGAGSGWGYETVQPREDNALLESLGEHYLDIAIRLASKEEWKSWLGISARIAVHTAATDVLPRLFAAYDDPVGDDTLAELLDIAAKGAIVEVLPALTAAGAGPKERSMSNAEVARREGVRGLGGELVRLGVQHQRVQQQKCFPWSRLAVDIVFVADSEFYAALRPFSNDALLESHGEQLLGFLIRLASNKQWNSWVDTSAEIVLSTGRTDLLLRLFAAHEGPVDEASLKKLLNLAAQKGHVGILSALLDAGAGAKVREVDEVRWPETALHLAARAGHRAFVAKLLEVGAPVDSRNDRGGTALTDAVEGGHTGVALELLASGADVDKIKQERLHDLGSRFGGFTPLGISVSKNDEDAAKVLLEAGADPIAGPTYYFPLHLAAMQGGFEIANHIILAGASVSSVDTKGRTALHIACAHNQLDVVDVLLRHNSDVASTCSNGQTPTDVVGKKALWLRHWVNSQLRTRRPLTLNSAETSTVDTICGMLQSAAAWGRRGWLVLMRSRHLAEFVEQSTLRDADDVSLSVGATNLTHEPCTNTVGVQKEERGVTPHLHDAGNARADCRAVVVWLLQSPDECLFRSIVQFL